MVRFLWFTATLAALSKSVISIAYSLLLSLESKVFMICLSINEYIMQKRMQISLAVWWRKKPLPREMKKKKKTNPCWLWRGISQVRKEGFEIFSSGFDIRISEKILNKILVFRSPFTLGFFSHFIFLFIFLFVAICVIWMPSPSCTMFMNHWHWTPYTYAYFLFLLFLNLFRTYYFERRKSL